MKWLVNVAQTSYTSFSSLKGDLYGKRSDSPRAVRTAFEGRYGKVVTPIGAYSQPGISIYYSQILLRRGLPFDVTLPNAKTKAVFKSTDKGRHLVRTKNAEDMFNKLGI